MKENDCRNLKIMPSLIAIIFIIFAIIMALIVKDVIKCILVITVTGAMVILEIFIFSLVIVAGESDRNSIKIFTFEFRTTEEAIIKIQEIEPNIFDNCNYINTYILNTYNNCYYEISIRNGMKLIRNIGCTSPKER